jgi:DivIVA domain-containing protein
VAENDPEKRIDDLERRLDQRRGDHVPGVSASERLTTEQVHQVAFSKPALFKRGYNEDEVDAFVERVRIELSRR